MDDQRDKLLARAVSLRKAGTERACAQLAQLSDQHPQQAALAYQAAWAHDRLDLEAAAVPYYERALSNPDDLSKDERYGCLLGLGSTFRNVGRYESSLATLRRGLAEFPDDPALSAFLAMTLYNHGDAREAVRTLLHVTTATSADPQVQAYRRAIDHYADHLDERG
ncbi:tetratricopeptide repeat protein [Streptacidiphilus sp. P02-A3a]|uniref:tetratricopeptide repeat protein n=1 Tax=Streptacidiphilus sp. P02-A3a TaxID=2704468 RepID=UPI0015F84DD7|nr:tetratricopeptide repeat protein [Streptacidiphilus sp. P02-A3a]QMU71093.1 tetratricopeptide repeat protein [Streptacidiphilus sp. P02-A3a]